MTTPRKKTATRSTAAATGGVELARLPELTGTTEPNTIPAAPSSFTEERREREYEEILDEIGTDGRIRVWHVVDGKSVFAGDMDAAGFTLGALLETFGGGDKSLVFYQGRTRVDTLRVTLDPSVPIRNPRSGKSGDSTATAPVTSGVGDMATLMGTMMTMQMQSMQASQQMMTGMVTAMTSLMAARPEKDPMEMALALAQVMNNKGGDLDQALSMLDRGLNLGKSLGGGHDEDGTIGVIKEGIGVIGKVIEASAGARAAQTPRQIGGPVAVIERANSGGRNGIGAHVSGADVGSSRVTTGPGESGSGGTTHDVDAGGGRMDDGVSERPWIRGAREHAASLAMAARFLSADTAAIELLRRMDDDTLEDFMSDADDDTAPGFEARVRAAFPNFQPTAEWFEQFMDTIRTNVDVADGADASAGDTATTQTGGATSVDTPDAPG